MDDERDEIVRNDFPIARRGYDPEAVRAHLEAVRERTSLAQTAGGRVASIIEMAEQTAAELERTARREAQEAQREAANTRAQARREAQQIISAARSEGKEHAERAVGTLTRLIQEAEGLRNAVARIAEGVTTEFQGSTTGGLDTAAENALPPETPKPQRSFRFRRPDSPAGVGTGPPETDIGRTNQ